MSKILLVIQWFIYNFELMGDGTRCFPYRCVQLQIYAPKI